LGDTGVGWPMPGDGLACVSDMAFNPSKYGVVKKTGFENQNRSRSTVS
jgi:hypothetical protein